MELYIMRPSIDKYTGVKVTSDTTLTFKNDKVEQTVEGLVLRTILTVKGDNYESVYDTKVTLEEGDILIFEEERGYIKPVESFVTVEEAIEELQNIKG